jgi:hypothetical protein
MLPKLEELALQKRVRLYNNIAKINDCEGRLLAELEVYPRPRIFWELEVLGDVECNFPYFAFIDSGLPKISGHLFYIEKPNCSSTSLELGPRQAISGTTPQAFYGDPENEAHKFVFYLPNAIFLEPFDHLHRILTATEEQTSNNKLSNDAKWSLNLPLDENWSLRLRMVNDAINWLEPKQRNVGTLITTVGELYQPRYNATQPETFLTLQTTTLQNALERLNQLSRLLSYANGGYLGPLYIEGQQYTQNPSNPIVPSSAVALAYKTTPIEQLAKSWLTQQSDLAAYINCLPTFERMMQSQTWRETFDFVRIEYFQAMQPGIPWTVVASSVGAALERLSYAILVEDEADSSRKAEHELLFGKPKSSEVWNSPEFKKSDDKPLSKTGIRLSLLLKRVGLTTDRDPDTIQEFLDVRNESVHPKPGNLTDEQRQNCLSRAAQWLDEVLLWRLGYNGKYMSRERWETSIAPRYDLSLRSLDW